MTEHSEIGASGCYRWWHCPASVTRSRGLPNKANAAAELGTSRHELGEICLRSGQDTIEFIDRKVGNHVVDEKGAADVQVYLDTVREWPADGDPLQVEVRFSLERLNPPGPMFGTADAVRYYPATRTLRIGDYKNGWVPVAIEGNMQVKYYAIGAMMALGSDRPVSTIIAQVVQPNNGGVKAASFDVVDLVEWSLELMDRAAAALDPAAPAAPGAWCRFCPVSGNCREQADAALALACLELPAMPPEAAPQTPATMFDEHLAFILSRKEDLIAFLAAVEAEVARRGGVPGWKFVPTRPSLSWSRPDEAAEILDTLFEVQPFGPPPLRTPSQIRDELANRYYTDAKSVGIKMTRDESQAIARKHLGSLITSASSGQRLVPDSDPRPALPAGGAEFLALPAPSNSDE